MFGISNTLNVIIIRMTKYRIVVGIIVGLFFSFSFYLFLYIFRETIRILSVTEDFDMWVLTDSEVSFYNLVYAFISVLLGQSVCFTFWFDRPAKAIGISSGLKNSILNDQRVLIWFFLFIAFQLAVFYGIWFGQASQRGFYVISLYPSYKYIFILIIIVLYFQQWNTIRQVYKQKSLKWLAVSLISVSIVSFGLSKINPVDYKKINDNILKRNVFHNYVLQLPESGFYGFLEKRSLVEKVYVVFPKVSKMDYPPVIIADNKEITLAEIPEKIHLWQSMRGKWEAGLMTIALNIDKDVKMSFIYRLKGELAKVGVNNIAYGVIPAEHKFDERYYRNSFVRLSLKGFTNDSQKAEDMFVHIKDTFEIENIIDVVQIEDGQCVVNGELTGQDQLKDEFMNLISQSPNYILRFYINEEESLTSYLTVITALKEVVYDLRSLKVDKSISIEKDIPFRVVEIP